MCFSHPIGGDVSDCAQASLPEDHPMAGTYPVFRWEEVVVCTQGKEDLTWHWGDLEGGENQSTATGRY